MKIIPPLSVHFTSSISKLEAINPLSKQALYNPIYLSQIRSLGSTGNPVEVTEPSTCLKKPLAESLYQWNRIIVGYNMSLQYEESWRTFCLMRSMDIPPDQFTYGNVLSACAVLQALRYGTQVYSLVLKNGFFSNGYVRTGMIDLFSKCFSFGEALIVFRDVLCENVVCWNAIISAAVKSKENWIALNLYNQMVCNQLEPNGFTYPSVLTGCTAVGEIQMARGVHGRVIKGGFEEDVFVGTAIVDMYVKWGDIDDAIGGFSRMMTRNVVSWTAIISGFVHREDAVSALKFFKDMRKEGVEINNCTLTSVLTACSNPQMTKEAIQIHSLILKCGFDSNSTVVISLINMYSKMGDIGLSEMIFREFGSPRTAETWAVMISGFAQNQYSGKAFELYKRMTREGLKPDASCSSSVLSITDCLNFGRQIHSYILKEGSLSDVCVGSALFTMYSKCGCLKDSYAVFESIHDKDEVSWTSMLAGFVEHGFAHQAFSIFREMVLHGTKIDQRTLSSLLMACSVLPSLQKGKEVHAYALHAGLSRDTLVGGGLVIMYSKCGELVSAREIFDLIPEKDQVSWSTLISGYAQNGRVEDSLELFREMLFTRKDMDSFTISSLLGMAATSKMPELGKLLHATIIKVGICSDHAIGNSLIAMYSKSGSIDDSRMLFDQIESPDLFTWTSMIMAYGHHGNAMEALRLYDLMRKKGLEPDSVTFAGVLFACSHSGLVEEGYFYLNSMTKDHGIKPNSLHYACIVDLLGRSGRLEEAQNVISNMPIKPDALVWGTLLAACKIHSNVELGRLAAQKVFELVPTDAEAYVSLSNILADMGHWEEVTDIRSLMDDVGVMKEPGMSFM